MEQQSKAFHIWKAVEMAAKARTEALKDNMYFQGESKADKLTANHINELLKGIQPPFPLESLANMLRNSKEAAELEKQLVTMSKEEIDHWNHVSSLSAAVVRYAKLENYITAELFKDLLLKTLNNQESEGCATLPVEPRQD
ncbi:TPA: hypothetical protein ACY4PQ_001721 [Vibrio parahaemolyticus]